jgi:flagellar motor switch/type III secretory pathway protein FliN
MSSLEEPELDALQEAFVEARAARAPQVEPRNFSQPRQLSSATLEGLSRRLRTALDAVVPELARTLRGNHKLSLLGLREVDACGLGRDLPVPFVVHGFPCSGETGWIVWDSCAAHRTAEAVITGSVDGEPDAGARLSRTEGRIVSDLLDRIAGCCALAMGLEPGSGVVGQDPDELITQGIAAPDQDGRRLALDLAFEGPGGPSQLRVLLPGVREERAAEVPAARDLPNHLDRVEVSVSACLGSIDVPLSQLLDLEVGDVIPLGVPEGSTVELFAEDRPYASASWGRHGDHLAVQVERLDDEFRELHPDTE